MQLKQFDILLVSFSPTKGSEQHGTRPCIVLETNGFMERGSITIVCPLTTNLKKFYSFETKIEPSKANGLSETSKLMLRQLRVIDQNRINKRLGTLEPKYHDSIRKSLSVLFDLNGDFSGF
jgi:mRNA interferase MazF